MRPEVKTEIPGPRARKIIEDDKRFLATSTREIPLVVERAEGVWAWDVDGNRFLDFASGIGVINTGHRHPRVLQALEEQMGKFLHFAGTDFYYGIQVELARRLVEITPGDFGKKVFYTNSGAESNEAAMKLTRWSTGRKYFLAFLGAFHGRTFGALSLTASKIVHRGRFFPMVPGVVHVPYPDPFRTPFGVDPSEVSDAVISYIEDQIFRRLAPPDEVAAAFAEPIQGEGGYVVPPKDFFPKLRRLLDEHGILLVDDEVQAGMGRTGRWFAIEHFGVVPDVVCLAKAIASGVPMGAIVFREDLDFGVLGAHSNTFGGNPLACAAALATIEVIGDLLDNVRARGEQLSRWLRDIKEESKTIGDVRGIGLMQAADFVVPGTKEPNKDVRERVLMRALRKGLILLPCGFSAIRFIPPLTITEEELDTGMEIFAEAVREEGA